MDCRPVSDTDHVLGRPVERKLASSHLCETTVEITSSIHEAMKTADSPTTVIQELFTSISNPHSSTDNFPHSSTDNFLELPDDIVKEVLGRLTVEEIARLQCLNKAWLSEMQRHLNSGMGREAEIEQRRRFPEELGENEFAGRIR